ncbi:glycosyltransferase [Pelagibacteraceae bacterium]|nr:glycosyltransferase [Pelagibacteraceae bacterium]
MISNKYNDKVTIIAVSFYSNEVIDKFISSIDKNIKILLIENSLNTEFKTYIENKFKNVEVIIPKKNLGNGGGINLGLKKVETEFALYLDVDTIPKNNMVEILLEYSNKINDYCILAPKDPDHIYGKELYKNFNQSKKFHKMEFITGCAMFFKMKILKKIGFFDENIFLYYEETDLYFRCHKADFGIYLIDEAQFKHLGSSAINNKYENEITINRNWHFCWSKFYYYKKNYGYFYGLKKTLPNLLRALKKYLILTIKGKKKDASKHKAEIGGLITSYLLKKSYLRPNIKL